MKEINNKNKLLFSFYNIKIITTMKSIIAFYSCLISISMVMADHEIRIWNNCPFTVWPGILNNPGKSLPENGGFSLEKYHTRIFRGPDGWAGRIWARTSCNGAGACETGDCGKCDYHV